MTKRKRNLIKDGDCGWNEEAKRSRNETSLDIGTSSPGGINYTSDQQPLQSESHEEIVPLLEDKEESGKGSNFSCSLKIQKLVEALENVIQSASESEQEAIDKDVVSECNLLWNLLKKPKIAAEKNAEPRTESPAALLQGATLDRPVLEIPPLSYITPWTKSSIPTHLPNLPEINNQKLENSAFTHKAVTTDPSALSYERLEWIGDAYCYLISTLLISRTFPSYLPGKCAQIREICVRNETLASYAREYGFEKRIRLPVEFLEVQSSHGKSQVTEKKKTKVLGDTFEAYVAALVMSDPAHGVERCISWLKPLWAQSVSKFIKQEDPDAQANVHEPQKHNAKDTLHLKICCNGIKVVYRESAPPKKDKLTHLLVFSIGAYYQALGEPEKLLAVGTGSGKVSAGMKAAEITLKNLKLLRKLEEKKKMFEEGMKNAKEQDTSIQAFV